MPGVESTIAKEIRLELDNREKGPRRTSLVNSVENPCTIRNPITELATANPIIATPKIAIQFSIAKPVLSNFSSAWRRIASIETDLTFGESGSPTNTTITTEKNAASRHARTDMDVLNIKDERIL
jgi:hypothetical protein